LLAAYFGVLRLTVIVLGPKSYEKLPKGREKVLPND